MNLKIVVAKIGIIFNTIYFLCDFYYFCVIFLRVVRLTGK